MHAAVKIWSGKLVWTENNAEKHRLSKGRTAQAYNVQIVVGALDGGVRKQGFSQFTL